MMFNFSGRMPRQLAYSNRSTNGVYLGGFYGRGLLIHPSSTLAIDSNVNYLPLSSTLASSPTYVQAYQQHHLQLQELPAGSTLFPDWPRVMPQDEEMLVATSTVSTVRSVNNGPSSPAHSDSDASSSSLELGSVRRGEHAQLRCR